MASICDINEIKLEHSGVKYQYFSELHQSNSNHFFYFQDVLSRPANEFGNDESVEAMWAMKAFQHAEIHFNVIILFM